MTHTSAIYVRQSEDKTGHATAVARQKQDCLKLADAKGWPEPRIYEDNSISATNGKARPAFEQLLADIEAGTVDRVAVWHLDRLTRSMRDLTRFIEAGRTHRVNLASVHGVSLDLGDPTGVAVAQILTAVAAMETAHKGERQRRANRQRAEAGKAFWTRRPFGYDRDSEGHVFVVDAEAEAIREGAKIALAGGTIASVARDWNARGLRTSAVKKDTGEGGLWGVTQVRRVLKSPRYAGRRLYNGDDMGMGEWAPILTEEQHRELEERLNDPRRRVAPDDLAAKHLLSGIARCGKCGGLMYAAKGKGAGGQIMVYRCFGGYCLQRRKDDVDKTVVAVLLAHLRPAAERLVGSGEAVRDLRARATDLRGRRDALAEMLADGLLSPSAVREQSGRLTAELRAVEQEISSAEVASPLATLAASRDLEAAWEATPLESQRNVIRQVLEVVVMPSGKGVRFRPEDIRISLRA
jgi:DNA invertase Pin-like site-specific DNA recombinase